MDTEYKAWFTIQCWGCGKCVTRGYHDHEESQAQTELLKKDGWMRRRFGPGADPWFCSEDCAFNSYNARTAWEWWGNHFINERRNRRLFWAVLFVLPFAIGVIALMSMR